MEHSNVRVSQSRVRFVRCEPNKQTYNDNNDVVDAVEIETDDGHYNWQQ